MLVSRYALLLGVAGTVLSLLDLQRGVPDVVGLLIAALALAAAGGLGLWQSRQRMPGAQAADAADLAVAGTPGWPYGVEPTDRGLELRTTSTFVSLCLVFTAICAGLVVLAWIDQSGAAAWVLTALFTLLGALVAAIAAWTSGVVFVIDGSGVRRTRWPYTHASWAAVTQLRTSQNRVDTGPTTVRTTGVRITAPGGITRRGKPVRAKHLGIPTTILEVSTRDVVAVLETCWHQARARAPQSAS